MKERFALAITPFAIILVALSLLAGLLLFVQTQGGQADPTIRYVAPGGACGGGVSDCYANPQDAVDASAAGDIIEIAAGTYTGLTVRPRHDVTTTGVVTQVLYLDKSVTVRGGYSLDFSTWDPQTHLTTLDAQGQGRGVYITGAISPTLAGLNITGGSAAGQGGYFYYGDYDAGGGVYVISATATLVYNSISGNEAGVGGGVFLNYNTSLLKDNQINNNLAGKYGGGAAVYEGAPVLDGNTFNINQSNNLGGGLYLFSTSARLSHNQITNNNTLSIGGGIDVASCSPTFEANVFEGNVAFIGGGIYLWYSSSQFTNDVFIDNHTVSSGAGLYAGGSSFTLLQTTFSANSAGDGSGLYLDNAGNTPTNVVISNTLVVSHSVAISLTGNSTAQIDGILWYASPITVSVGQDATLLGIQHQYTGDPAFDSDGYHLTASSAAIGKGQPFGVATDVDGQPRSLTAPDLGADEFWAPGGPRTVYLPLVNR